MRVPHQATRTMEHLHPTEDYRIVRESTNTLLIDCRTEVEFFYVGHPTDAINIEWNSAPDFQLNPQFADEVLRMAGRKDRPIILICRSGKRSLEAGKLLAKNGFTAVYNITEGFEGDLDTQHHRSSSGGWRFRGLPWEQC